MTDTNNNNSGVTVISELLHHGAAAHSSPKVIATIPKLASIDDDNSSSEDTSNKNNTQLVYASHLILNVVTRRDVTLGGTAVDNNSETKMEQLWSVTQTLRTQTSATAEMATAAANVSTLTAKRVITCVKSIAIQQSNSSTSTAATSASPVPNVIVVCGFSDGSLTSWHRDHQGHWTERLLPDLKAQLDGRSVTDLDGYYYSSIDDNNNDSVLSLVVCTSGGAHFLALDGSSQFMLLLLQEKHLIATPCNVCNYHVLPSSKEQQIVTTSQNSGLGVFLVGTAAPRHNKIHVLTTTATANSAKPQLPPTYCGALAGHEDWITCLDWITPPVAEAAVSNNNHSSGSSSTSSNSMMVSYLASGSQDAKIRLWKWVTTTTTTTSAVAEINIDRSIPNMVADGSGDDDDDDDEGDEEVIEGEARLEIVQGKNKLMAVYLEALLVGHEEMVTSVAWHPNPQSHYQQDLILLSASMDRSIFVWSSSSEASVVANGHTGSMDGVWTPIARVGSAGGILGGSVGSSLLGYLNIKLEPTYGRWIMGHAYGGSLHFFSCETLTQEDETTQEQDNTVQWRAQACLTGHFEEVTDLCWEAHSGEYLITVSNDQTCRLWAPIQSESDLWVEIARPQVHGYDLSAVTSLSTVDHRDLIVTGADEKEIRVFDGTISFLRMLRNVTGNRMKIDTDAMDSRVERAYIPALGLTNKASAADGADEDTSGASESSTLLPLERDLGSISLWPEIRKLFGHNSEIARLTSNLTGRSNLSLQCSTTHLQEVFVASTTKARDVETANIRLWDSKYRCVQVLKGGHRSTVTALCFSPTGSYLASSGKDRRLCIWRRKISEDTDPHQEPFFLAAAVDSSHKRIVWSAHFCPFDSSVLVTGSRDMTVKLWKLTDDEAENDNATHIEEYCKFVPKHGEDVKSAAVTCLAFSPLKLTESQGLLAIGFEDGILQLWSVSTDHSAKVQPSLVHSFDPNCCHIGAVNKIAWKPVSDESCDSLVLASCSTDSGCRIFRILLKK